jgi:hypothetical protein
MKNAGGEEVSIAADRVLVAVGRRPRTGGFGLESLMLDMNGRAVRIDNQCRTSMRNVWAIGDLAGEPMLAHRAMAQGEMVAEIIAGKRRHFMPAAIPAVCFTDPEVVVVGMTPAGGRRQGLDCISASFPFAANGRAMTHRRHGRLRARGRAQGQPPDRRLAGGRRRGVGAVSTAFVQSIEMGAQLEDVGGTIHAHPTLGEAVQEAALRRWGTRCISEAGPGTPRTGHCPRARPGHAPSHYAGCQRQCERLAVFLRCHHVLLLRVSSPPSLAVAGTAIPFHAGLDRARVAWAVSPGAVPARCRAQPVVGTRVSDWALPAPGLARHAADVAGAARAHRCRPSSSRPS